MPDVVLKSRDGTAVTHKGVVGLKTLNSSGELEIFYSKENARPFDCLRVTFMNGAKIHYVRSVAAGDNCADPVDRGLVETPTKESTAQYDYALYGWGAEDDGAADDTILQNITEDKIVYAIYTAMLRYYTITYCDEDGVTVLNVETLPYGATPSYLPEKEGYTFIGWTTDIETVTGDAVYVAQWEKASDGTVVSGACGDSVFWALYDTGALEIYGAGAMTNFASAAERPWHDYVLQIKTVTIAEGVTSIGDHAFRECSSLTNVTIPDGVTRIGYSGFYKCTNLTDVSIPSTVTSIGDHALRECASLTSITIPDGVTSIGYYGFYKCTNLTSITIPGTVTSIGNYAFAYCASLTSITIPDGVTSIGDSAFQNCTSLTYAYISNTTKVIGKYAFLNCNNLAKAKIRYSTLWYVTKESTPTNGSYLTINTSDQSAVAVALTKTYVNHYWYHRN